MIKMIAGSYDYIESQREDLGDEFVDSMLDSGYEPVYIPDRGWRWVAKSDSRTKAR